MPRHIRGFSTLTAAALAAACILAAPGARAAARSAVPRDAAPLRATPPVLVASYSGAISPVAVEFLVSAVERAGGGGFSALVIELDTPGGLDLSMREIVKAILASRVPVIVYVSPAGGRAASAGVFIAMAAHLSAMAPGTNIGAAHPVQIGRAPSPPAGPRADKDDKAAGTDKVMEDKLTHDAGAYLTALAARRGRNAALSLEMVSKSTAVSSGQAVASRIVDLEADTLAALLDKAHGRKLPDFKEPLNTRGAALSRMGMTRRQRVLAAVSDPNVAMVLMSLGVSGLLIELYSPGLILPGVVGTVSLVLAFYSFQTLSANYAGVLLILLGLLFYLLELKVTSWGLLALSGTAALILGSAMLFRDPVGGLRVSNSVLFGGVGTILAVTAALLYVAKTALGRPARVGLEGAAGQRATTKTTLEPMGDVCWNGELWRARSLEGSMPAGTEVVIDSAEGLTLMVRRRTSPPHEK